MNERYRRNRWGERAFWNLQSLTWDDLLAKERHRARVEAALALAGSPEGGPRVLDLGCGTGTYSVALAREGFDVVGLDFAPAMLRRARAKAGPLLGHGIRFERADFNRPLPFRPGAFDLVLCVCALHCVAHVETFLAEVHRVLVPGGRLVLVALAGRADPDEAPGGFSTTLPRRVFWSVKRRMARGGRWARYPRPVLLRLLAEAGFDADRLEERGPAMAVRRSGQP